MVNLVGFIIKKIGMMHGHMNIKFVNAKQAKETYQYRNTREKLYKTNAAIWYNKICRGVPSWSCSKALFKPV